MWKLRESMRTDLSEPAAAAVIVPLTTIRANRHGTGRLMSQVRRPYGAEGQSISELVIWTLAYRRTI